MYARSSHNQPQLKKQHKDDRIHDIPCHSHHGRAGGFFSHKRECQALYTSWESICARDYFGIFWHYFENVREYHCFPFSPKLRGSSLYKSSSSFILFCLIWLFSNSPSLDPLQWSTSRRCLPSLKALAPLEQRSHGTLPLLRPRGPLSSPLRRWKSPAASHWRCARFYGNSAPQTQNTGTTC